MSQNNGNRIDTTAKHSDPIPISGSPFPRRNRSASMSSASSSSLSSVGSELPTPITPPSASNNPNRINLPSPSTSPILSYFFAQSPTKTPATFPFKSKIVGSPVFEEEEQSNEPPVAAHARRASTAVAGRFASPPSNTNNVPILSDPRNQKGTGLLRRLSLGSAAFAKPMTDTTPATREPPAVPPNSTVDTAPSTPFPRASTKPRRSATIGVGQRPRRAPSPMGERILKGHFDGFN